LVSTTFVDSQSQFVGWRPSLDGGDELNRPRNVRVFSGIPLLESCCSAVTVAGATR
jgi:hypothetical protein